MGGGGRPEGVGGGGDVEFDTVDFVPTGRTSVYHL